MIHFARRSSSIVEISWRTKIRIVVAHYGLNKKYWSPQWRRQSFTQETTTLNSSSKELVKKDDLPSEVLPFTQVPSLVSKDFIPGLCRLRRGKAVGRLFAVRGLRPLRVSEDKSSGDAIVAEDPDSSSVKPTVQETNGDVSLLLDFFSNSNSPLF